MKLTVFAALVLAAGLLAGCTSVPSASAPATAPPIGGAAGTLPTGTSPPPAHAVNPPSSPAGVTRSPAPSPSGSLKPIADEGHVTYSVTLRPGQCHARDSGRLPDPACTPGSVDPAVTQSTIRTTICVTGWTTTVRPPASETTRAKFGVSEPAYGITAKGELDHLVPLELGGSNDISNLWPEAGAIPNPKDKVEGELKSAVCAGKITLDAARLEIARDWETARP